MSKEPDKPKRPRGRPRKHRPEPREKPKMWRGNPSPMAVLSERLLAVEEMLTHGWGRRRMIAELERRFGVHERTIHKWIAKVHRAWAAEAKLVDRDTIRAQHRERLTRVLHLAVEREVPATSKEDGVVYETDADGAKRPVMIRSPDVRAAARILDLLAKLDNLNEETVKLENADNLVDLIRLATVRREKEKKHAKGKDDA